MKKNKSQVSNSAPRNIEDESPMDASPYEPSPTIRFDNMPDALVNDDIEDGEGEEGSKKINWEKLQLMRNKFPQDYIAKLEVLLVDAEQDLSRYQE